MSPLDVDSLSRRRYLLLKARMDAHLAAQQEQQEELEAKMRQTGQ